MTEEELTRLEGLEKLMKQNGKCKYLRGQAADNFLGLIAEVRRLREALWCISRMKTMPDHKTNTITLVAAHSLAISALKTGETV